MSAAQFTLHGAQGKWLIAHCLMEGDQLRPYLEQGKIFFKGSSTVSCLTRLLADTPMRLCGRISARGMKGALAPSGGPHTLLYEQGRLTNVDQCVEQTVNTLGPKDLFITGANALDAFGHAALLVGGPGGGAYGQCMAALYTSGVKTWVLSSVNKLIPGNLDTLYRQVSKNDCDYSYGMSCSLMPIPGEIITETQALAQYAGVEALVFAAGGHTGAEDSIALQVRGSREQVERVLTLVERVKAIPEGPLMEEASERECAFPCPSCGGHRACRYAKKQRICREQKG